MGELGDQERESDSTTLGLVEKERLNLTMGEGAVALFEVKSFFFVPQVCGLGVVGLGTFRMARPAFGGLMGAGWGRPLPGAQGKKNLYVIETCEIETWEICYQLREL